MSEPGNMQEIIGPWDDNIALISDHPEIHHYTDRTGLEGIWRSQSLRASHYSNLTDSSEVIGLKELVHVSLFKAFKQVLVEKRKKSFRIKREVSKQGGIDETVESLTRDYLNAHYETAFIGDKKKAMAEPYIFSFCSHGKAPSYESNNGLLSQWRGYGSSEGRFALVFDTAKIDEILKREWERYYWVSLQIDAAIYFEGPETVDQFFPDFIELSAAFMRERLEGLPTSEVDIFVPFSRAATLIKHNAFREEREIRIVAIPVREEAMTEPGREEWFQKKRRHNLKLKTISTASGGRRFLFLFDDPQTKLPIKRVIVGPGSNHAGDIAFAEALVGKEIPIVASRTPYIGR